MSDYTREAFERDRFATAGPVQPPATPQEPDVRGDIGHQNAEIQRLGNAVRDGSATSEMAYAWLTHPYVCTSDMVKAAARIMASAPPAVWQPIETAPMDGTPVLLLWFDAETSAAPMHRVGFWHSREQAWCDTHRVLHNQHSHPTHWTQLPSPPTPGRQVDDPEADRQAATEL